MCIYVSVCVFELFITSVINFFWLAYPLAINYPKLYPLHKKNVYNLNTRNCYCFKLVITLNK